MNKNVATWTNVVILVGASFAGPLFARTAIYDILAKGSEWTLNVDGDVGTLKILGGKGGRTPDGGWEMGMDVDWQGNTGTLQGWADGDNREQRVELELTRSGGFPVVLSGYIARETGVFMAGTSRYAALPDDIEGAWYATKGGLSSTSGAGSDSSPSTAGPGSGETTEPAKTPVKPEKTTPTNIQILITPTAEQIAKTLEMNQKTIPAPTAACRVSGSITGAKKYVGEMAVYSADNRQVQTANPEPGGTYRFRPLPDGTYRVRPIAGGKFDLKVKPGHRNIVCRGSQAHTADFEILGLSEG